MKPILSTADKSWPSLLIIVSCSPYRSFSPPFPRYFPLFFSPLLSTPCIFFLSYSFLTDTIFLLSSHCSRLLLVPSAFLPSLFQFTCAAFSFQLSLRPYFFFTLLISFDPVFFSLFATGRCFAYIIAISGGGWGWSQFYLQQMKHAPSLLILVPCFRTLPPHRSFSPPFPHYFPLFFSLLLNLNLLISFFFFSSSSVIIFNLHFLSSPFRLSFLLSFHFRCLFFSSFLSILFFVSHFLNLLIPPPSPI